MLQEDSNSRSARFARPEQRGAGPRPFLRQIQAVKEGVRIERVARDYGELRLAGRGRLPGRCVSPDHADKTPSLTIFTDTQTFKCFGIGCGAHGDAIDLVRLADPGSELWEALVSLSTRYGVELPGRPECWHAKQERQRDARSMIEAERVRHVRTLIYRLCFAPWVRELPEPVREECGQSAWEASVPIARRLYERGWGSEMARQRDRMSDSARTASGLESSEPVYDVYDVYDDPKQLPAPKTYPVDAMPRGCRQLTREAVAAIGCPPEFVALPMLAVLSSAIGNSRVLKLKEGWEEAAGTYAAVIADPGEKKTPGYKAAIEPATRRQAALRDRYQRELDEYKRELRAYEVDKRAAAKDGVPAPPPPQPPVMGRTVVEDTTVEALAVVLEGTPRGVVAVRDELAGWVRAMDQYRAAGRGADRQFWLSAWSSSYVAVDRKTRGEPLILPRPFVSVFGSIQPGVLDELGAGREDGLLDRFVFAYPDPVPSRWSDAEISAGARDAYRRLYDDLRGSYMPEDAHGDPDPVRVHFSPDAKTVFIDAVNTHRAEMDAAGFPARLKGPWSKLEAYMARLSLLLALARAADTGDPERVETGFVALVESERSRPNEARRRAHYSPRLGAKCLRNVVNAVNVVNSE